MLLRREADRLAVERNAALGKLQQGGCVWGVEGVEPRMEPLGSSEEVDVLPGEAGVYLGEGEFGIGHVNQSDGGLGGGGRGDFGAQVAGSHKTEAVLFGLVHVNTLSEDDIELNLLTVHGRGSGAAEAGFGVAAAIHAEGRPQEGRELLGA